MLEPEAYRVHPHLLNDLSVMNILCVLSSDCQGWHIAAVIEVGAALLQLIFTGMSEWLPGISE